MGEGDCDEAFAPKILSLAFRYCSSRSSIDLDFGLSWGRSASSEGGVGSRGAGVGLVLSFVIIFRGCVILSLSSSRRSLNLKTGLFQEAEEKRTIRLRIPYEERRRKMCQKKKKKSVTSFKHLGVFLLDGYHSLLL